ncbi:MAG: sugar ABC transporter ATP-binding protein [Actinobacteria bacterium]|nr:sugar ABC transporter ATP-binding protein [Actinomycetota bacterium]
MENNIILKTNNILKKFGDNTVLNNICIEIKKGEVHAIVGENGAGKTTLMNILSGIVSPTSGSFEFDDKTITTLSTRDAINMGISVIHQELALVPTLSVYENIFLSKLRGRALGFITNFGELKSKALDLLARLGEEKNIRINDRVEMLNSSHQQIVEIAKALSQDPKLLIMDEPTASLTENEVQNLFRIINNLKNEGISIIYISHILEEVFEIAERISVLRDGEYMGTKIKKESSIDEIIKMMVGRKLDLYHKKESEDIKKGERILEVKDLEIPSLFRNINFYLKRGEILGFSGLVGSGRSEVARAIFGAYKNVKGKIILEGREVKINSPKNALRMGIGMLPEDRRAQGFVCTMNISQNLSLAVLYRLAKSGFVKIKKEKELVDKYIKLLNIKAASINSPILSLSGGNQQKVVFAKWLAVNTKILIVDEPTQGIDVGTKSEIHNILSELAAKGISIILISSELPEILSLSDRIIVMRLGRITGELSISKATQEKIMYLSAVNSEN